MVFDGKADTRLTSLDTAAATPEEGVSAANLSELAFVGEVGFAEGCDVNSVAQVLWLLGLSVVQVFLTLRWWNRGEF